VGTTPEGAELASADAESAILTIPNLVTALRLACLPVFVWLVFGARDQGPAAILLAVLGATDWVDGFLARRLHQVSALGKVLDPLADRLLVGTAVIVIIVHGAVPVWFGVVTLSREALVGGIVLVLAVLGAARIDVLWVGKAGTFGLMFAYPAFLLGDGTAGWQEGIRSFAWVAGIAGLTLAWIAAAAYIRPARAALAAGRRGRRQAAERAGASA
jgi:cardiolipin synthase (CMP-forming)